MNTRSHVLLGSALALLIPCLPVTGAVACTLTDPVAEEDTAQTPINTPPSSMPLQDYERDVLYPWLWGRGYADEALGWTVDSEVRDTGPFVEDTYYGTHPAVRIYYSPEVRSWIDSGRQGDLPDGSIIVKEMFLPPAAIYNELQQNSWFQQYPNQYQALESQLLTAWAVMIKDRGGDTKDGWFWSSPGNAPTLEEMLAPSSGNLDDNSHVSTSNFGVGTCIRCHASADGENTFVDSKNYLLDDSPLQFRVDNSWRTKDHLGATYTKISAFLKQHDVPADDTQALLLQMNLPEQQRPWTESDAQKAAAYVSAHMPRPIPLVPAKDAREAARRLSAKSAVNTDFVAGFADLEAMVRQNLSPAELQALSFPFQWADHVVPSPAIEHGGVDNPSEYITSDNCYGCHGGLGGAPYANTMFVQTGPKSGDGYNISEYGEWRWSPMGLAGRDPIFHAQLESELITLLQENGQLNDGQPASGDVRVTQQALTDTCLRCHGAMGLRQKGINQGGDILNPGFDANLFYIEKPLTEEQARNPDFTPPAHGVNPPSGLTPKEFYSSHDLGELAREGISCAICHRISPPDPVAAKAWVAEHPEWFGDDPVWSDSFFFLLGTNTTGLYTRNPANELFGPFDDVKVKPMENALGITPQVSPSMHHDTPFTADSAMCGTCHTINLPNIGSPTGENPILTALEPNPHFQGISHSIEQATYLEWLNSSYGLGKDNKKGPEFQSCQDCHMPNSFETLDGSVSIPQLATQIATIQDSTYPQAENQLSQEDLDIATRANYRRHELVGLNAFLIEMFNQFPDVLGVAGSDYETGASTGAQLAMDSMLLSAQQERVATVLVESVSIADNTMNIDVTITNKTGHRFPSGVTFRRAFVELLVFDTAGTVIWGSGRTNAGGLLVDADGRPLRTEFLDHKANPYDVLAEYQPNYQIIKSEVEVQIYEELITNAEHEFTTSFVHRVDHIKDNRLLPAGAVNAATFAGEVPGSEIGDQGKLLLEFMQATEAEGPSVVGGTDANGNSFPEDKNFTASPNAGTDQIRYAIALEDLRGKAARVQATLYSQSLMPAWFHQRFSLANAAKEAGYDTPETDRLFYLSSRLDLTGTPLEDWKMKIAADSATIAP